MSPYMMRSAFNHSLPGVSRLRL